MTVPTATTCPPLEDLEQIAAGHLAEPAVFAHVTRCPTCSEQVAEMKVNNDLLAEVQVADSSARASRAADENGVRIPGYELVREIHRGGQGVVYEAVQTSTGRAVAVKTMRGGRLASVDDRARFDREVHVLGRLRHPNIVTIHDSGAFGGMDYFVMDYIEGTPLDVYVESRSSIAPPGAKAAAPLTVREKLTVFAKICDALNAAHLHGIVHRDLKPGNIRIDAEGQPHLLDFGLAKLVSGDSDTNAMTITGQFVGSLPWAAPEQAEGAPGKIDIRTDVYAVGVMLYQMLTGKFPYSVIGGMREVTERIIAAEPLSPRTLNRGIDDEVETIVLKCLQKERDRRYQSAGELARDIRRYLAGEPIEAKRDSGWYLMTKMLHRHKAAVGVAAAFAIVTVGSAIALAFMYHNQSQARAQAVAEAHNARIAKENETIQRQAAELAREDAEHNLRNAELESARANSITSLLQGMLVPENANTARPADYTFSQVLDNASRRISVELKDRPDFEAAIRFTIGAAYRGIAEYDKSRESLLMARQILLKLYGPNAPELGHVLQHLALTEVALGQFDAAEKHCRESIAIYQDDENPNDEVMAACSRALSEILRSKGEYAEAEVAARQSVRLTSQASSGYLAHAVALNELGMVLHERGRYEDAEATYRQVLEIRRNHVSHDRVGIALTMNNLTALLTARGRYDDAITLGTEALSIQREELGPEHWETATILNTLAIALRTKGDLAAAEPLYREALAINRKVYGDGHPDVARTMHNLALLLHYQGRYEEAEPLYQEALSLKRQIYSDIHPEIARSLNSLGGLRFVQGDHQAAEQLYRESLDMRRQLFPEPHPDLATSLYNLAGAAAKLQKWNKAEALYRQALEMRRRVYPPEHPSLAATQIGLSDLLLQQREFTAAEPQLRECLAHYQQHEPDVWNRYVVTSLLGKCLAGQHRFDEAEPLLLEAFEGLANHPGTPAESKQNAARRLAEFYDATDRPEEAQRWRDGSGAAPQTSANAQPEGDRSYD